MKRQPLPGIGCHRRPAGWTAYEMVVILLIAASLVGVGSYAAHIVNEADRQQRQERIRFSIAMSAISCLVATLDDYKTDTGHYPSKTQGLQALVRNVAHDPKWDGPYLRAGLPLDPWGHPYQYKVPGYGGEQYTVFTTKPDGKLIGSGPY